MFSCSFCKDSQGECAKRKRSNFYLCMLLKGLCITDSQTVVSSAETHSAWKYERLHITESWREKRRHKKCSQRSENPALSLSHVLHVTLRWGGAVEMFKRLPHPVWHVHVLTLPCPLSQYILKDTYSVTARCKALGILNCRQRVFVGFCFQFHAGLHFSFEGVFILPTLTSRHMSSCCFCGNVIPLWLTSICLRG